MNWEWRNENGELKEGGDIMATKLEMSFKNAMDNKSTISIDNPKSDITDAEVAAVMQNILNKNIFNTNGGDLVSIGGARVMTTTVDELTVI